MSISTTLALCLAPLAAAYGGAVAVLALRQRSFIYRPPQPPPPLAPLHDAGYAPLDAPAHGAPLFWFAPPASAEGRVVAFLHGNATTIVESADKLAPLRDAGHGVLLVEYPGFGHAHGQPAEDPIVAAALAGLDALVAHGIAGERIVLWGESLGTGVATQLACARQVAGVVLEAPFTSVATRAQEIYWWTPARWLVRDRFDNLGRIAAIGAPLLVAHGEQDLVTPARHGRALLAAATHPKRGFFAPHAGHTDLTEHGMTAAILGFIADLPREARG
jgi:pimeloyl-ACP methyl ester carboxylesterase